MVYKNVLQSSTSPMPLIRPLNNLDEINEMFDGVHLYTKGAVIVKMIKVSISFLLLQKNGLNTVYILDYIPLAQYICEINILGLGRRV